MIYVYSRKTLEILSRSNILKINLFTRTLHTLQDSTKRIIRISVNLCQFLSFLHPTAWHEHLSHHREKYTSVRTKLHTSAFSWVEEKTDGENYEMNYPNLLVDAATPSNVTLLVHVKYAFKCVTIIRVVGRKTHGRTTTSRTSLHTPANLPYFHLVCAVLRHAMRLNARWNVFASKLQ